MSGVTVDIWCQIEACSIRYRILEDEVELQIGEQPNGVTLIAAEADLSDLISISTAALQALHTKREALLRS